jgi:hypothetical protein
VASLPAIDFREIVALDANGKGQPDHNAALRSEILLKRWHKVLGQLIPDVERQLAERRGDKTQAGYDWRRRNRLYRDTLTLRARECKRLIAEMNGRNTDPGRARILEAQIAAAAGMSRRELRKKAAEIAVDQLIEAHREEFHGYMNAALADLGVGPKDSTAD